MSILAPTDFTGRFSITKAFQGNEKIQEYIDFYETIYMNKMLGAALFVLYTQGIEDETEIYETLRDPFAFDSTEKCKVIISKGVEHMLKCLIYSHYYRGDLGTPTSNGKINIQPEAGKLEGDDRTNDYNVYNEGIQTLKAIQQYIIENESTYPEYNGQHVGTTWII